MTREREGENSHGRRAVPASKTETKKKSNRFGGIGGGRSSGGFGFGRSGGFNSGGGGYSVDCSDGYKGNSTGGRFGSFGGGGGSGSGGPSSVQVEVEVDLANLIPFLDGLVDLEIEGIPPHLLNKNNFLD